MKDSQEKPVSATEPEEKPKPAIRSAPLVEASPLQRYVSEIASNPILSNEEERELAVLYREKGDIEAARKLVASNLKFVVKVAGEYKNYNINIMDIIQEGNLGLMHAVKRFDPTKGYRLISYAVWWIKAYIQKHIMDTWSLVRIGTGREQRKLFYKVRSASSAAGSGAEKNDAEIANSLGVSEKSFSEMKRVMGTRDLSLHSPVQNEAQQAHVDFLTDSSEGPEAGFEREETKRIIHNHIGKVLEKLKEKERHIVENRLLTENPETLDTIGSRLGISRERVRQIEQTALKKLRREFEKYGITAPLD